MGMLSKIKSYKSISKAKTTPGIEGHGYASELSPITGSYHAGERPRRGYSKGGLISYKDISKLK